MVLLSSANWSGTRQAGFLTTLLQIWASIAIVPGSFPEVVYVRTLAMAALKGEGGELEIHSLSVGGVVIATVIRD